jgi:GNAT superfamily N-acetyltransferase
MTIVPFGIGVAMCRLMAFPAVLNTKMLDGGHEARNGGDAEQFQSICQRVSELIALHPNELLSLLPSDVESVLSNHLGVLALEGATVAGFTWLLPWGDLPDGRPVFEFRSLVVHPEFRSHGLGTGLIKQIVRIARDCSKGALVVGCVRESNDSAARLLLRLGALEITQPPVIQYPSIPVVRTFDLSDLCDADKGDTAASRMIAFCRDDATSADHRFNRGC